jgi:hypothetical protein
MAEEKTQTSEETTEEVKAEKEQETETEVETSTETTEPKVDWEHKFKELQSGLTPKLQKLSELEKRQKFTDTVLEQLANKTSDSNAERDVNIDDEIREIDSEINTYRDAGFKDDSYEVKMLVRQKRLAVKQKKSEESSNQLLESSKRNDELGAFMLRNPDFDDYDGLATIIAEAEAEGDKLSFARAHKIWLGDHSQKVTSQKTKEALAQKKLSDKARSETSGDIVEGKTEDDEEAAYRNIIAPPDTIN